jgi:hypothetical protein
MTLQVFCESPLSQQIYSAVRFFFLNFLKEISQLLMNNIFLCLLCLHEGLLFDRPSYTDCLRKNDHILNFFNVKISKATRLHFSPYDRKTPKI